MHGMCGWFDINFIGSLENIILTTAPECPGTHWYQCKMLLREPIAVNRGQTVSGELHFIANEFFSYYIDMTVQIDGTNITSKNRINLKDQVSIVVLVLIALSQTTSYYCCCSTIHTYNSRVPSNVFGNNFDLGIQHS
jgi:hypothetical protein